MSTVRRSLVAASVLAVLAESLLTGVPSRAAMGPEEKARRSAIVAKVGPKQITAGELEDRIAEVPRFQLTMFGDTPGAVRHKFLSEIVVRDALYALGAEAEHLDTQLPTVNILKRALSNATVRAVRAELGPASAIPNEEVARYYEKNKSRYDTPERYAVWRILCKTREEALAVIDAAKKDLTIPAFNALARDHSIDQATNQRGGNLGFVGLDGTSNEAELHVDPATVKAAATVKDGELVPSPIPEGGNFAVVWHRGTVQPVHRSVEDVAAQIRDTLWKRNEEIAVKNLVASLRARDLKELNDGLLNGIEISTVDGTVEPRRRTGQVTPLNLGQSLPR
jgi:peptidyl-prolyl cis-trans isomerase C